MSHNPIHRVQAGVPTGGQFAASEHAESSVQLADSSSAKDTFNNPYDLLSSNSSPLCLTYVDYDDSLTKDQIGSALKGDWDSVQEEVDQWTFEPAYEEANRQAEEEIDRAYEEGRFSREYSELSDEEKEMAVEAIQARDESTPLNDLLRQTKNQTMRTNIGVPADRAGDRVVNDYSYTDEERGRQAFRNRVAVITELLSEHGVDTSNSEARKAIESLVNNGPGMWHEGVKLDVIWNGDVADATATTLEDRSSRGRQVTFESPSILLMDPVTGQGSQEELPGTIQTVLSTDNPAYLDHEESPDRWSWAETSGTIHATNNPITTGWVS